MPDEPQGLGVVVAAGNLPATVSGLLASVRPEWQHRSLIERVKRILPIDPSSACQRLLNAAFHDLRQKVVIAGIDLAQQAAASNKLPPISKAEDVLESYSTTNVLDLAYRIGILSRPEWRRLQRAYEIRKDLEHEDDQYEAQPEDCFYIFKTSIEIVLAREPLEVLRVADVETLIQQPDRVAPSADLLSDYERAPESRQVDIAEFLVRTALKENEPDVVRQNAIETLRKVRGVMRNTVKIELGKRFEDRLKRNPLSVAQAKVATAGGFMVFLKQRQRREFFEAFAQRLWKIPYRWTSNDQHRDILVELEDVGGLAVCPPCEARQKIVLWGALCYLGEPGKYGTWGRNREVFYSNSGAWRIESLMKTGGSDIKADLEGLAQNSAIQAAVQNKAIARRYEALLDLVETL